MICILSQSFRAQNTEGVMRWLEKWAVPCCRLNADDLDRLGGPSLEIRNGQIESTIRVAGRTLRSTEVDVVWYSQWNHSDPLSDMTPAKVADDRMRDFNLVSFHQHLSNEFGAVSEALFSSFRKAVWLNDPKKCDLNKIEVLSYAQRVGLDTPETIITSRAADVQRLLDMHPEAITKCASNMSFFKAGDKVYQPYTCGTGGVQGIVRYWQGGALSLFQEKLDRCYELRVFYLDGECVTTARIFRRTDLAVADGRTVPKRSVPFALPQDIKTRLVQLMTMLRLDMACVDIVRTRDDRWVFLEVNPNGFFGHDGYSGNHGFEKRIASALVERLHGFRRAS